MTATDFAGNESEPSLPAGMATDVPGLSAAPSEFFLGPAVPNPFNPVTEISYGIPAGAEISPVILTIYGPTGRLVRTLVHEDQGPGTYRVTWNGADDRGRSVASGVYFYRITWNEEAETRRMVLLK